LNPLERRFGTGFGETLAPCARRQLPALNVQPEAFAECAPPADLKKFP
jgi:hypothetical protein